MSNDLEAIKLRINGTAEGLAATLNQSRSQVQGWANSINSIRLNSPVQSWAAGINRVNAGLEANLARLQGAFGRLTGVIAGVFGGAAAARFGLGVAAEAEQAQISFEVLLRSAEKARALIADLKQFSAATPFEFPEIRAAANQLLGFGFAAEEILPLLQRLGDMAAGSGSSIGELAYLIGTSAAAGRIMTADLNQFAGRGLPILDALAQVMGRNKSEIRDLAAQGVISFDELRKAIEVMAGEGGFYFGLMEKQSASLLGKWSTLKDSLGELSGAVANLFVPSIKSGIDSIAAMLDWLKNSRSLLKESVIQIAAFAAGWAAVALVAPRVVAAIVSIIRALRALITTGIFAQSMTGAGLLKTFAGIAAGAMLSYSVGKLLDAQIGDITEGLEAQAAAANGVAGAVENIGNATQDWARKAEQIRGEFATPLQQFKAQIEDLANTVKHGGLEWELFEKAAAKALQSLRATLEAQRGLNTSGPRITQSFLRGSAEAVTFRLEAAIRRDEAVARDQLKQLKEATLLLESIRNELQRPPAKKVADF